MIPCDVSIRPTKRVPGIVQGYGLHFQVLGATFVTDFFRNLFTGEILYATVLCLVKFSILAFYWRLFNTSIRLPIYILGAVTAAWWIAIVSIERHHVYSSMQSESTWLTPNFQIIVTIFQCFPVSQFWERTDPSACQVDVYAFFLGNAVPNILTDAAIIALPVPYIWSLHRSTSQKIALCGTFALGSL